MMTERKWTPGPWHVGRDECDDPVVISECLSLELDGLCWHANSDANAYLISAAPELYEALEDCANFLKYDCAHMNSAKPELMQALAALAKARGEA